MNPIDVIESILEHSGAAERKAMQEVLRDKLAYFEELAEQSKQMEDAR